MNFEDQLSPTFKVEDLTITNHSLASPNIPNEGYISQNLTYLADTLEFLLTFFDFEILSGFRTKELQQKLAAEGEPVSSGLSFHEVGRAVDLLPYGIDLSEAFGLILATPALRERFAEIAYKPGQNSLHLAINVPGDIRTAKILGLNSAGVYASLPAEEQQIYVEEYQDNLKAMPAPAKFGIGLAIAAGAAAYFLL